MFPIKLIRSNLSTTSDFSLKNISTGHTSSPRTFVALPVSSSYDASEVQIVLVRRQHLHAAMSAPDVRSVEYDFQSHRLIITGPRVRYALPTVMQTSARCMIQRALLEWSATIRKKRARAAIPRDVRRAEKIQHAIAVQKRKLAKIYLRRPVNPLCIAPTRYDGKYLCTADAAWAMKREVRRQLAKLSAPYIRLRKTPRWKMFYEEAEKILGHAISECNRHSRVIRSRHFHGDFVDYLEALPRHADGQQKPWRDNGDFQVTTMRDARKEFLAAKREADSIRQQIAALEAAR